MVVQIHQGGQKINTGLRLKESAQREVTYYMVIVETIKGVKLI